MFKNFRQDCRIADARVEASAASRQADKAHLHLERVNERLDHLSMITEALWHLLKEKTGWSDDMLMQQVRQLDRHDGTEDGRRTPRATPCHDCGRNLPARGRICIYCGATPPVVTPFDVLW